MRSRVPCRRSSLSDFSLSAGFAEGMVLSCGDAISVWHKFMWGRHRRKIFCDEWRRGGAGAWVWRVSGVDPEEKGLKPHPLPLHQSTEAYSPMFRKISKKNPDCGQMRRVETTVLLCALVIGLRYSFNSTNGAHHPVDRCTHLLVRHRITTETSSRSTNPAM
jgi:hypothetical protein